MNTLGVSQSVGNTIGNPAMNSVANTQGVFNSMSQPQMLTLMLGIGMMERIKVKRKAQMMGNVNRRSAAPKPTSIGD